LLILILGLSALHLKQRLAMPCLARDSTTARRPEEGGQAGGRAGRHVCEERLALWAWLLGRGGG